VDAADVRRLREKGAAGAACAAGPRGAGGAVVRRRSCAARPVRGAPAALRGAGRREG
jgi:hypothetical protein